MLLPYLVASGIVSGALYALVALGLVLVYRATRHLNFAHGEQFMVGGFLAYTFHAILGLPYVVALLLGAASGFLVGIASDRLIFRPLADASGVAIILATVGLSYLLKGIGRWAWGSLGEVVPFPPIADSAAIIIAGVPIIPQQLVVLAAALGVMLCFLLFFRWTMAGKIMEAVAENRRAAYLVGMKVERVHMLTWGAGGLLAAVAAVLMAPLTTLNPDIGFVLLLKAFAAAVLGGLGSIAGAVLGGLLLGVGEALAGGLIHTSVQHVSAFVIIFIVLVIRPQGLLGTQPPRSV